MPDILTPQQRHKCMSHIRGKDTSPEMVVRRFLHANGFRYSLHRSKLPGKPDIVLRKYRTCIFVNGCFWHGHMVSRADGSMEQGSGSNGSSGSMEQGSGSNGSIEQGSGSSGSMEQGSGSSGSSGSMASPVQVGVKMVPCKYFKLPKTNPDFWRHKIELNQARDYRTRVDLKLLGWNVITIWECQLMPSVREETLLRLKNQLQSLVHKKSHTICRFEEYEQQLLQVAEDEE